MWSLHHSFNVFHTRREVQAMAGWHCHQGFGKTPRARSRSNTIVTAARCSYGRPLARYTHATIPPHPIAWSHTRTLLRLHVSSEFGLSLFVFTLTLVCSHLQPSAGLSILHICRSLPPLHLPSSFSPPMLLSHGELDPDQRTESRLQTGVVLIKLLKRTCIQGWFRAGCSYIQPNATNVRKDVLVRRNVSLGLHESTYLRGLPYFIVDSLSSLTFRPKTSQCLTRIEILFYLTCPWLATDNVQGRVRFHRYVRRVTFSGDLGEMNILSRIYGQGEFTADTCPRYKIIIFDVDLNAAERPLLLEYLWKRFSGIHAHGARISLGPIIIFIW